MPDLSINFTDNEFEYIREICRLANTNSRKNELILKLDNLNSAEVDSAKRDIEQYKRVEYGTEKSKGGIKGTDFSQSRNRHYLTNKMRERLNYPPIAAPLDSESMGMLSVGLPNWSDSYDEDEFSQQ